MGMTEECTSDKCWWRRKGGEEVLGKKVVVEILRGVKNWVLRYEMGYQRKVFKVRCEVRKWDDPVE